LTLSQLWELVKQGTATFETLGYLLNEFAIRFFESNFAINLFGVGANFDTVKEKYAMLPYILMIFGLVEAFFGRRFLKTQKFLFGFIVGFSLGVVYVATELSYIVGISPVVIGLALGIVLALFRSPFYWVVVTSTVFYIIYYQFVSNFGFVRFFGVLISVLLVAFIIVFLTKWLELVGTAILGAWIFASVLSWGVSFPEDNKKAIVTVITVIVAILGFTVQFIHDRQINKKKREEI
jgi:hypothetical protein